MRRRTASSARSRTAGSPRNANAACAYSRYASSSKNSWSRSSSAGSSPRRLGRLELLDPARLPARVERRDPLLHRPRPRLQLGRGAGEEAPAGEHAPAQVVEERVGERRGRRAARARRRASGRRPPRRRSPPPCRSSRAGAPPWTGSARTARSCSCRCARRGRRSRAGPAPRPWPSAPPPRGSRAGCARRPSAGVGPAPRAAVALIRHPSCGVVDPCRSEDSTTGRNVPSSNKHDRSFFNRTPTPGGSRPQCSSR